MKRAFLCSLPLLFLCAACRMRPLPPAVKQTSPPGQSFPLTAPVEIKNDFGGSPWRLLAPWADALLPSGADSARDGALWEMYQDLAQTYHVIPMIGQISGLESIAPSLAAGQTAPDVLGLSAPDLALAAAAGYILPVDDARLATAGFNPADETRFHQGLAGQMRWHGRQWSVQVASRGVFPSAGTFLLYNRDLLQSVGASNLEDMAETGHFTWEYYQSLASAVTGKRDTFAHAMEPPLAALAQTGLLPVMQTEQSRWYSFVKNSQLLPAAEFLRQAAGGTRLFSGTTEEACARYAEGSVAFFWLSSHTLLTRPELLSPAFSWGILPLPRAAASTPSASLATHYEGYAIAQSDNPARSATVFNAFAAQMHEEDWLASLGQTLALDDAQIRLIRQHVLPNRFPCQIELEPTLEEVICARYIAPLLEGADPDWQFFLQADDAIARLLPRLNAE